MPKQMDYHYSFSDDFGLRSVLSRSETIFAKKRYTSIAASVRSRITRDRGAVGSVRVTGASVRVTPRRRGRWWHPPGCRVRRAPATQSRGGNPRRSLAGGRDHEDSGWKHSCCSPMRIEIKRGYFSSHEAFFDS